VKIFLLATLVYSSYAVSKIDWNDSGIKWMSYQAGLKEMARTGKKGVLVIYADWCPTCLAYSKIFKRADVINASKGLIFMRLNSDKQPKVDTLMSFDGNYVPRTIALSSQGKVMHKLYKKTGNYRYYVQFNIPKNYLKFIKSVQGL